MCCFFFFQAEDGIRDGHVTGVQTCALPIWLLGPDGEELSSASRGQDVELVLDRTPFYAESGGQVGDKGIVRTADGAVMEVADTRFGLEGFSVHTGKVVEGELHGDQPVLAEVDPQRRAATARSNTATP